jgi:internalin A
LEKLDALKSLDLGIIHAKSIFEIGFLRDLEVLFLVGDCITDASPISRLRQLRKLVLEFPTLERAVDLSGMKEIEYVSIYCDAEEPVILDGNDNLKSLSIRSSPLVRVPRINKTAVNLESVSLNAGRLSDLSFLHGMPRLQSISLIGANDLDMLSEDAMPSLKNLSLSHVRKMQLSRIAGYERIEYLFFRDFGGAELDLAPLSNFSALKHISFVGCMQLANLEVLNGLPSIETVYFRGFDVKPKFIRSILPSVSSIYVNGRKV